MKLSILYLLVFAFVNFTNNCPSNSGKNNNIVSSGNINTSESIESPITQKESADELIWQGESGGFEIKWTKENITAKSIASGKQVFSAREFAAKRLKNDLKDNFDEKGKPNFEDFTFRFQIISITGNFLSLHEKTSYSPQSYSREKYLTIDLNTPENDISLQDFFDEKEILKSLTENKIIGDEMKKKNSAEPANFAAFRNSFHKTILEAVEVSDNQFDKCWFPEDVFKSFAFKKISEGKSSVNLAIPCRAEMREDDIFLLEISLPIPEKLNSELKTAADKKLLADDFQNISEKGETVINFDSASIK